MKNKTKQIIAYVAIILVASLIVGFVSYLSQGFRDWDVQGWFTQDERNPDNLIALKYYDQMLVEKGLHTLRGGDFVVNTDGSISFTQSKKGTATVDGATTVEFTTLTLNPGTYTYTGAPKGSDTTYKLIATYTTPDGVDVLVNADFVGNTFYLNAQTEVTFSLVVADSFTSDEPVTVYPMLVVGDEAGEFYID